MYSFPVELAAKIAVHTVNRFLQDNPESFDLVEWVLFDAHTESVYKAEVDKLYKMDFYLEALDSRVLAEHLSDGSSSSDLQR